MQERKGKLVFLFFLESLGDGIPLVYEGNTKNDYTRFYMVQVKGLRKLQCENREASGKVFAELFSKSDLPAPAGAPKAFPSGEGGPPRRWMRRSLYTVCSRSRTKNALGYAEHPCGEKSN